MSSLGEIASRLPTSKSDEDKSKRSTLFKQFDPNGNGYLSLAEIDKGLRESFGLDALYNCKPAIMRAFQASKGLKKGKGGREDDYVSRVEFRMLLVYLKQYFELFQIFASMDQGQDRRVDLNEFKAATPQLISWGMEIQDPVKTFHEVSPYRT
mmetsp:Transcript_18511/g.60778  ORF Transcript_18511/g.60778 Transcript_18511/m.60778 type:complete len:153 (-) Transcript_18511:491-949(-)